MVPVSATMQIGTASDCENVTDRNRSHLFTFLDHPDTPPDNNGSERELRPTATYRKVTGGFRSNWGADLFAASPISCRHSRATWHRRLSSD